MKAGHAQRPCTWGPCTLRVYGLCAWALCMGPLFYTTISDIFRLLYLDISSYIWLWLVLSGYIEL